MPRYLPWAAICLASLSRAQVTIVQVNATVPTNAPPPVLPAFISLANEFYLFPALTGSSSAPNLLSQGLVNQLYAFQQAKPIIRVGGTSQDHAIYNGSLPSNTPTISRPTAADSVSFQYGPAFLDAFNGLHNVTYDFGLNLGAKGFYTTPMAATVVATAAQQACQYLGSSLNNWELGNEPDLYTVNDTNHQFRSPSIWRNSLYVSEWLNKSSVVTNAVPASCKVPFVAPSFYTVSGQNLTPVATWQAGLGNSKNIDLITGHIYIASANGTGVTLAGTLMNHTQTALAITNRLNVWNQVTSQSKTYFSFNEVGSLVPTGQPGISNTFGAALWTMDFSLFSASRGVGRLHWQQGSGFAYNAWQPTGPLNGTKAPYYGLVASADFIGNAATNKMQIIQVTSSEQASSYALYRNGTLVRLAIIQMTPFNSSTGAQNRATTPFYYRLPSTPLGNISVRWLAGPGSNTVAPGNGSFSGITFGNLTYETSNGSPLIMAASPNSEGNYIANTTNGDLTVLMPPSSAVVLQFN